MLNLQKIDFNKINHDDYYWLGSFLFYKDELFTGICNSLNNDIFYYKNGLLHREDGPAAIRGGTIIEWWIEGIIRRKKYNEIDYYYDENGLYHREDGPAVITRNDKLFYLHGCKININTKIIKSKKFIF